MGNHFLPSASSYVHDVYITGGTSKSDACHKSKQMGKMGQNLLSATHVHTHKVATHLQ